MGTNQAGLLFTSKQGKTMACIPNDIITDRKTKCQICSNRAATAWWMAGPKGDIFVCQTCAAQTLPTLAVDALNIMDVRLLDHTLDKMQIAFWRAATLRLLREKP